MMQKDKLRILIIIIIVVFIASLIRTEYITILCFIFGFFLAEMQHKEKWIKL
jgi:hypothetical protein